MQPVSKAPVSASDSEWENEGEEIGADDVDDVLVSLVAINDDEDEDDTTTTDADEDEEEAEEEDEAQGRGSQELPTVTPLDRAATIREDAPVLQRKLSASVKAGELSAKRALGATRWMDVGIRKLLKIIFREGTIDGDGRSHISFGRLSRKASRVFWGQALVGHLKAAKVKGAVDYKAERLVQGVTDSVDIIGLRKDIDDSNPDTYTYGLVRACSFRKSKSSVRRTSKSSKGSGLVTTLTAEPPQQRRRSSASSSSSSGKPRKLSASRGSKLLNAMSTSLAPQRSGTFSRQVLQALDPTEEETDAIEDVLASLATAMHTEEEDDNNDNHQADDVGGDASVLDFVERAGAPVQPELLRRKLSISIKRGELNPNRALQAAAFVDKQLRKLSMCIQEAGQEDTRHRRWRVTLARLADAAQDTFDADQLLGLLHTARDRGLVALPAATLCRPDHDNMSITLLAMDVDDADEDTYTYEHIRAASIRRRPSTTTGPQAGTAAAVALPTVAESPSQDARMPDDKRNLLASLDLLDGDTPTDLGSTGNGSNSTSPSGRRFIASGVPLDVEGELEGSVVEESEEVAALQQEVESLQYSLRLAQSALQSTRTSLTQEVQEAKKALAAAKAEKAALGEQLTRARREHEEVLVQLKQQRQRQEEQHAASLTRVKDTANAVEDRVRALEDKLMAERQARHQAEAEAQGLRDKHEKDQQRLREEVTRNLRASIRAEVEAELLTRATSAGPSASPSKAMGTTEKSAVAAAEAAAPSTKGAGASTPRAAAPVVEVAQTPEKQKKREEGATVTTNRVMTPTPLTEQRTPSPAAAAGEEEESTRAPPPVTMTQFATAQTSAHARIAKARAKAAAVKVNAAQQLAGREVKPDQEAVIDVLASMTAINRRDTLRHKASMKAAARAASAKTQAKAAANESGETGGGDTGTAASKTSPKSKDGSGSIIDQSYSIPETAPVMRRKLSVSVRRGELNPRRALAATRFVDDQIRKLIANIKEHGSRDDKGRPSVAFGRLFDNAKGMENLSGTLRTAKKQNVVAYGAELLLKGMHDSVIVTLLQDDIGDSNLDTYTYQQVREASTRRKLTSTLQTSIRRSTMNRSNSIRLKQLAANARSKRDANIDTGTASPQQTQQQHQHPHPSGSGGVKNSTEARTERVRSWHRKAGGASALLRRGRVLPNQTSTPSSTVAATSGEPKPAAPATSSDNSAGDDEDENESAVADVLASMAGLYHKQQQRLSRRGKAPPPSKEPVTASDVPEDSRIGRRRLSASVRKGELSQKRAMQAARWIDKELRKLIAAIVRLGRSTGVGDEVQITFGELFKETQNEFEALTGTLRTAKKHKVVRFESEMLFQGAHDHVVITLLKREIPDASIDTYTYTQVRQCSDRRKLGKAFGQKSLQTTNSKCYICKKTVYPMEFVGASDKAFHKQCFRCSVCKKKLRPSDYATVNDQFFCRTHYERAFKSTGGTYAF